MLRIYNPYYVITVPNYRFLLFQIEKIVASHLESRNLVCDLNLIELESGDLDYNRNNIQLNDAKLFF